MGSFGYIMLASRNCLGNMAGGSGVVTFGVLRCCHTLRLRRGELLLTWLYLRDNWWGLTVINEYLFGNASTACWMFFLSNPLLYLLLQYFSHIYIICDLATVSSFDAQLWTIDRPPVLQFPNHVRWLIHGLSKGRPEARYHNRLKSDCNKLQAAMGRGCDEVGS